MSVRLLTPAELTRLREHGTLDATDGPHPGIAIVRFYNGAVHHPNNSMPVMDVHGQWTLAGRETDTAGTLRSFAQNCTAATLTIFSQMLTWDGTTDEYELAMTQSTAMVQHDLAARTLVFAVCCTRMSPQVLHDCVYCEFLV
jgi:hypothetical protein